MGAIEITRETRETAPPPAMIEAMFTDETFPGYTDSWGTGGRPPWVGVGQLVVFHNEVMNGRVSQYLCNYRDAQLSERISAALRGARKVRLQEYESVLIDLRNWIAGKAAEVARQGGFVNRAEDLEAFDDRLANDLRKRLEVEAWLLKQPEFVVVE